MEISKQQVVEFLEARGLKDNARQAEAELPDPVDTDEHHAQLSLLGVDLDDIDEGPIA
jgi:hypothetical protein